MFSVFDHGKITKNGGRCGGKSCWHGAFSCKHVAKRQLRTIFTPSFSPVGSPRRGLAAVVARWLGVACPAGAGGCAPLRPLRALRAAWFLWQFAPRGTGAVARGASGWHTGGCGRLPFGIAKQAVLHGETGRSGRPRGTFGSAIRRKWLRGRGVVNVFHSPRRIAPTPVRHGAEYGQSDCRRAF